MAGRLEPASRAGADVYQMIRSGHRDVASPESSQMSAVRCRCHIGREVSEINYRTVVAVEVFAYNTGTVCTILSFQHSIIRNLIKNPEPTIPGHQF